MQHLWAFLQCRAVARRQTGDLESGRASLTAPKDADFVNGASLKMNYLAFDSRRITEWTM
jgi:hypothetical protein